MMKTGRISVLAICFIVAGCSYAVAPGSQAAGEIQEIAVSDTLGQAFCCDSVAGIYSFARPELPAMADSLWFIEYPDGEFAIEYSPSQRHPKWVAWQLHSGHDGDYTRSEAWHFDSRINPYNVKQADFQKQQDFLNPGKTISYDRGHLCPSNDRTATYGMNAATYVYSNMSPQLGAFNQGIWARLEACINEWSHTPGDTLYICAGGTVISADQIAGYTVPNRMAIPKYYFKVVLRKRGAGQYDAIGFWFEHRDYGRKNADLAANLANITVPVDSIETLTGLDFFHALPECLQYRVESQADMDAWTWKIK